MVLSVIQISRFTIIVLCDTLEISIYKWNCMDVVLSIFMKRNMYCVLWSSMSNAVEICVESNCGVICWFFCENAWPHLLWFVLFPAEFLTSNHNTFIRFPLTLSNTVV